ncbi:MAG: rane dipeptidase [Acidobacteriota bacterium]|jgi:membrane dipeptidase|nr:rane dipeptidase [Acidobacteriota bacterium]
MPGSSASDSPSAVHGRAIIVDGHCDTPYRLHRHNVHLEEHDPEAQLDLRSMRESGITASFFAAYVPPFYAGRGAAAFAYRLIELIHAESKRSEELVFCDDAAGIRAAKRDAKLALMIGVEGGHAIEDSLDTLRDFYARGVRYMTLTHVNTNNWCDSSGDAGRHGGLTDFGREVVSTMNDLGMIVDISHVSDNAFYQVIETTRVPVIATHSSCRAICRHPRNMTDDMLRTLAKNGGVCMINFFSAFISDDVAQVIMNAQKRSRGEEHSGGGTEELPNDSIDWDSYLEWFNTLGCPQATIAQVVDHIMHAAEVAGIDHVGIGSDFDGVPALPAGLQTAAGLPGVTEEMLRRGMSAGDVEKVLGGNFLRVFEEIERGARR